MTGGSDPRDDSPAAQSLMTGRERSPSEEKTETDRIPSDTLRRAPHVVFLTLAYAAIVLFTWAVLCILAHRPIGARSYTVSEANLEYYLNGKMSTFAQSERYLRAARFCQSVASVLTIPLTSMVCSCSAVAFLQRRRRQSWWNPTLRQSMVLADKSWNDPVLIAKLLAGGWKRYGSLFLLFAIVLNLVGASITPLQGLFVSYKSIKVPTEPSSMDDLVDLEKSLYFYRSMYDPNDGAIPTTQLRSRLMSTDNADPQFRLWSSEPGCGNSSNESSPVCTTSGQFTFGSMPNLSDPFWAQPPAGFQTGLWRQFAPRINFTSKYENITADAFPSDCSQRPGALYLHYQNMTDDGGYIVDICMPADQTQSPWKATRARQDFSEELYVKMTLDWKVLMDLPSISFIPGNYSFKVTLNTSAGYFELPNYENGQLPGPLLHDGPNVSCGAQCMSQGVLSDKHKRYLIEPLKNDTEVAVANLTHSLSAVMSKGPLLSTTLALFGAGSYLDIQHTIAEAYHTGSTNEWGGCIDILPFIKLLRGADDQSISLDVDPCVEGADAKFRLQTIVADYIWLFAADERRQNRVNHPPPKRIQDAFAAAAFLAVDVWMQEANAEWQTTVTLNWDMGADHQVPDIPHAGVVLISVLLGTYLVCMLGLSLYSAWTPRWTNQLDAFAVMRIGAAVPGRFPLRLAHDPDEVEDLDKLPGWIGGATGVESGGVDGVGELGLGGEMPLRGKKRYRCYAADDMENPA